MAWRFPSLNDVRRVVGEVAEVVRARAPAASEPGDENVENRRPPADATSPPPITLGERLIRAMPLGLFIAGGLLTLCAELVGGYQILGYLWLTAAPIVYWLRRIEQRLSEQPRPRR